MRFWLVIMLLVIMLLSDIKALFSGRIQIKIISALLITACVSRMNYKYKGPGGSEVLASYNVASYNVA